MDAPLELRNVSCQRGTAVLRGVSLAFGPGTFTLLAGTPDSGHELLLRVLGLLEAPDTGEVLLAGTPTQTLLEEERAKLRDRRIGFVFAAPFLLAAFTPIENVAMPLFKVLDFEPNEAQRRGEALLDFVGLPELIQAPCSELALANQHRVSLARALAGEPAVLLIENLDGVLAGEELSSFSALVREAAVRFRLAVVATVSAHFAAETSDRVIEIADGVVRQDSELLPKPKA